MLLEALTGILLFYGSAWLWRRKPALAVALWFCVLLAALLAGVSTWFPRFWAAHWASLIICTGFLGLMPFAFCSQGIIGRSRREIVAEQKGIPEWAVTIREEGGFERQWFVDLVMPILGPAFAFAGPALFVAELFSVGWGGWFLDFRRWTVGVYVVGLVVAAIDMVREK
jgi:hypothetical protein